MKPWQWAVLMQPLFILAYVGVIAGCIWLVQKMPESWLKRLLLKRWDGNNR